MKRSTFDDVAFIIINSDCCTHRFAWNFYSTVRNKYFIRVHKTKVIGSIRKWFRNHIDSFSVRSFDLLHIGIHHVGGQRKDMFNYPFCFIRSHSQRLYVCDCLKFRFAFDIPISLHPISFNISHWFIRERVACSKLRYLDQYKTLSLRRVQVHNGRSVHVELRRLIARSYHVQNYQNMA